MSDGYPRMCRNWMAIPHQQLYDDIHAGPGIQGTRATQDTYARIGDLFAFVEEQIETGLARLGVAYEGAGSDAAQSGITVLRQWTQDAQAGSRYAGELVAYQAQSYTRARDAMPEPVRVTAQDGFIDSLYDFFGGTTPREVQEQQARQAHVRAADVMRAYDEQSAEAADAMPAFVPPPPVTVDVAPASSAMPPSVATDVPPGDPRRYGVTGYDGTGYDARGYGAGYDARGYGAEGYGAEGYGAAADGATAHGGGAAPAEGTMWRPPMAPTAGVIAPGAGVWIAPAATELAGAAAAPPVPVQGSPTTPGGAPPPSAGYPGAGHPGAGYPGGVPVLPGVGDPRAAVGPAPAGRRGLDGGYGPRGFQPDGRVGHAWGGGAVTGAGPGYGAGIVDLESGRGGTANSGLAAAGYLHPAVPGGGHWGGSDHRRRYTLMTDEYFADDRLVPPPVIGVRPQP